MHIDALCYVDGKKHWCSKECCFGCSLLGKLDNKMACCKAEEGLTDLPMRGQCKTFDCFAGERAEDKELAREIIYGLPPGEFKMSQVRLFVKVLKVLGQEK